MTLYSVDLNLQVLQLIGKTISYNIALVPWHSGGLNLRKNRRLFKLLVLHAALCTFSLYMPLKRLLSQN